MFTKKSRHRRRRNSSGFPLEERVVAVFIAAAVIRIMLIIVMQKACFSAYRAWRIFSPAICSLSYRTFGDKLMMTVPAEILLITVRIFAVTILKTYCKFEEKDKAKEIFNALGYEM